MHYILVLFFSFLSSLRVYYTLADMEICTLLRDHALYPANEMQFAAAKCR
jgi:hypothetical protein